MCIRNDAWRSRSEGGKQEGQFGGRRSEGGGGGGPGGHTRDEGEELVMVMRRCNDSSAVCSEFSLSLIFSFSSLSLSHALSLFSPFPLSVPLAPLDSLPSLCLRMAMIPGTAYAPFYALLFTGIWLLSVRVAISTVCDSACACMCTFMCPRAHTSHNGTAAHFKHGK